MVAAGCRSLYPMERLSVMGLFEAAGRYLEVMPMRARLERRFAADPPDVFVGVDAPDFNLPLERKLRQAGIRTVHYVSPSVWAWRRYRIRKIARSVDLMLTLFPFEARFYEAHRVPVRFVGHPLADLIPGPVDHRSARRQLSLPMQGPLVALLPGSRMSEVKYLAEPLVRTARWLVQRHPDLRFVAPLVEPITRAHFEGVLRREGQGLDIRVLDGRARTAMAAADTVLLASGTASLEALLLRRPMVITYRTTALTHHIMKAMLRVDYIGLPNLLAGEPLVPELIQRDAVPERLGPAVLEFLESRQVQEAFGAASERIHAQLRQNADAGAAEAILRLVAK